MRMYAPFQMRRIAKTIWKGAWIKRDIKDQGWYFYLPQILNLALITKNKIIRKVSRIHTTDRHNDLTYKINISKTQELEAQQSFLAAIICQDVPPTGSPRLLIIRNSLKIWVDLEIRKRQCYVASLNWKMIGILWKDKRYSIITSQHPFRGRYFISQQQKGESVDHSW